MIRAPKLSQIDAEERFLTRVTWAYHVEGLTQEKVAERLGATRLRVNKSLSEARAMAAGDLSKQSLLTRDALPSDMTIDELIAKGGVGEVLGAVIDVDGKALDHPINERVIGIGLADLARIPNVILAAGGLHKVAVNRALLGLGVVNTPVMDEATARALIE